MGGQKPARLTIKETLVIEGEKTGVKDEGDTSRTTEDKGKQKVGEKPPEPLFNPILSFFDILRANYQGQRLDKMLELQQFALKDKETYRDAYHRLRRLVECTEGVTPTQAIHYWYNILDAELKDLVRARVLSLPITQAPTLEYVFLTTDAISVNLAREKALMPLTKPVKATEKSRTSAKSAVPACTAEGEDGAAKSKTTREKFCSECGSATHGAHNCWILHPELKPKNAKVAKGKDSKKEKGKQSKGQSGKSKETSKADKAQADNGEDRLKNLEAQLATLVKALTVKNSSSTEQKDKENSSFYGEYEDSLCGFSEPQLPSFVTTRAKSQVEVPRGADVALDPQAGEARRQVRLPESFVLEEVASDVVSKPAPRIPTATPRGDNTTLAGKGEALALATTLCQTPFFTAQMVKASGFDVATVFETAAAICRAKGPLVAAMEAGVEESAFDLESLEDTTLEAAAARLNTLSRRPAIERSSVDPGVVLVDNSKGVLQIVGPHGKVFTP